MPSWASRARFRWRSTTSKIRNRPAPKASSASSWIWLHRRAKISCVNAKRGVVRDNAAREALVCHGEGHTAFSAGTPSRTNSGILRSPKPAIEERIANPDTALSSSQTERVFIPRWTLSPADASPLKLRQNSHWPQHVPVALLSFDLRARENAIPPTTSPSISATRETLKAPASRKASTIRCSV